MKQIPLTQGRFALVDDADFEYLGWRKWTFVKIGRQSYAVRHSGGGKRKNIYMHDEIMKPPPGMKVDHKDGDGLNNQRGNLRICTHAQNLQNRKKNRNNTSGYKGTSWDKTNKKHHAKIQVDGHQIYLGLFAHAEDAARAYDDAATKYFGEFANLNFPK